MKSSKARFILIFMAAVCAAVALLSVPAFAVEDIEILDSLPDFGEDYIPSSKTDSSADDKAVDSLRDDIVEIIVSNENLVFEANGDLGYIDVFGKLKDGGYINITNEVECEFYDDTVAAWSRGRISAERKGKTTAELTYNGVSKEIEISVKRQIIDSLPDFDDDYFPGSAKYYTIDNKLIVFEREEITDIIVSNADVEIEANRYSAYIDVFGKLKDGRYIDITDEVKCTFEDGTLAMWIFGRILAERKGKTTAVLTYNGVSTEIEITVNKQITDRLPKFDKDYIPSSKKYYTDDNRVINPSTEDIAGIIVSNANVEIEANGCSEYIDVFGSIIGRGFIDITDEVECKFEDESIATWSYGRISAKKRGTTTAVLTYNGVSKEINITVKNQIYSKPHKNNNPDTGIAIALLPMALAAGTVALAGKKRLRRFK